VSAIFLPFQRDGPCSSSTPGKAAARHLGVSGEGPSSPDVSRRIQSYRLLLRNPPDGGRTWWAHFEFTRINTTPTFLRKKIEDARDG
jgi:hypothetical protein